MRHLVLAAGCLVGGLCATAIASERDDAAVKAVKKVEVRTEAPRAEGEPVRLRTRAGTFEVNPKNAELLRAVIAGDARARGIIYAGGDIE